jgi:hypothetical protein
LVQVYIHFCEPIDTLNYRGKGSDSDGGEAGSEGEGEGGVEGGASEEEVEEQLVRSVHKAVEDGIHSLIDVREQDPERFLRVIYIYM